jgi:hypothetical protein
MSHVRHMSWMNLAAARVNPLLLQAGDLPLKLF